MVFTLSDGTLVYYLVGGDTNPMVRLADGSVTVNTDKYELSRIKNFYVSEEDDPNGVESVLAAAGVTYGDNTLVIRSAASGPVKVYTAGGTEVQADIQAVDDVVTVNLGSLPKGVYVVYTGGASFKVYKK